MKTNDLIKDLRVGLKDQKEKGIQTIPIENLENFLNIAEEIANDPKIKEHEEFDRALAIKNLEISNDVWKTQEKTRTAHQVEMFKAVIESGQTALKSATLINGGAAVALLAFIGNLLTKQANLGDSFLIAKINSAMAMFVAGVGFSGFAAFARYASQALYAYPSKRWGDIGRNVAVLFAVGSFAMFVAGGITAYLAFPGHD